MMKTPPQNSRWKISNLSINNKKEIQHLFSLVFKSELTDELFNWKYANQHGFAVGAWLDHELVGHYAGFSRKISFFGTHKTALQIGDVMVHPKERAVLTRKGVFFLTASYFFETNIGNEKPFFIAFGFPNQRAIRIGKKLNLYAQVEKINIFLWQCHKNLTGSLYRLEENVCINNIDNLWEAMSQDTCDYILTVRDLNYFKYRYLDRPEGAYKIFVVKNIVSRKAISIIVLKFFPMEKKIQWLDYVGSISHIKTTIKSINHYAKKSGFLYLDAWLTQCMEKHFVDSHCSIHPTDIEIAQSNWQESRDLAKKNNGRWWLMYGDTEFL